MHGMRLSLDDVTSIFATQLTQDSPLYFNKKSNETPYKPALSNHSINKTLFPTPQSPLIYNPSSTSTTSTAIIPLPTSNSCPITKLRCHSFQPPHILNRTSSDRMPVIVPLVNNYVSFFSFANALSSLLYHLHSTPIFIAPSPTFAVAIIQLP